MYTTDLIRSKGWEGLSRLGIKIVHHEGLVLLNYDQIESPKHHPVTKECRSLVLDEDGNVISRSFDRFFNAGEVEMTVSMEYCKVFEKMDGSLISIYYHNGWKMRTSGMLDISGKVWNEGEEITWKDFLDECFQEFPWDNLNPDCTYICEAIGPANRVVVQYDAPDYRLLAIRHKEGHYIKVPDGFKRPREYRMDSIDDCKEMAARLPNLEEGYVVYDRHGVPFMKIKNPAYVAAHHLKGDVLNLRRIIDLVVMGEEAEYLAIFPQHAAVFEPVVAAHSLIIAYAQSQYTCYKHLSRKELGLKYGNSMLKPFIFSLLNGKSVYESIKNLKPTHKLSIFTYFIGVYNESRKDFIQ